MSGNAQAAAARPAVQVLLPDSLHRSSTTA